IRVGHSGLFLQAASSSNGADITQQPDTDAAGQQWRTVDHGGGVISLVNRQSGLALDVWEASTADGARISQWAASDRTNQRFQLHRVQPQREPRSDRPGRAMSPSSEGVA
ncbi:MAG TPA: RICIN domain-containing protein, partial [Streptomyces sp.]|nr:RICIN domain-containing protein [Streptomyces sp.]